MPLHRQHIDDAIAELDLHELHVETLIGGIRVGLRRALSGLSKHGVFVVDAKGVMRYVSPSAARMLGYEPDELIGKFSHPIIHHHHADGSVYPVEACTVRDVTEPVLLDDECLWRKDGTILCALFRAQPVFDDDGARQGTMVYFEKIKTPRRGGTR